MSSKVVRVDSWEDFKHLVKKHGAKELAYRIEMGVPARNLTSLRLILPVIGVQYVFIDTAGGDRLKKTGIKFRVDDLGNVYLSDEDVINFVKSEIGKDIKIYSYFTI
ncbi:MAG: hypothetical protein N3E47_00235 [Candidatus Bathyarchaeota archaeon]|nr:hypothetical protein [Candidatus Bathyarchaeota archaeon]